MRDLDPYADEKRAVVPFLLIGAAVMAAAAIFLLATGGVDPPAEPTGDLRYVAGRPGPALSPAGPIEAAPADIAAAAVELHDEKLIFQVGLAGSLPDRFDDAALELRWNLAAEDGDWVVAARLDKALSASLLAEVTGYGSGTLDGTFPGTVAVDGRAVTVRVDTRELDRFPDEFEWRLTSTLRAYANDAGSPSVVDSYPDKRTVSFPS